MASSHPSLCSPLLLLLFLVTPLTVTSKTFPGDTEALKAVKQGVDPRSIPSGSCLSTWDFAVADPCDAAFSPRFTCGLRCDTSDAAGFLRVTELALDPAGYSGSITPSVWSLPFLESLELADNSLAGAVPLPPPAGLPPRLRRLSLSRNAFSGEIPGFSAAPALEELYLDNNLLSGPIPPGLATLPALRRLELQTNNLTGEIPDLGPLQNLTFLDASNNALSGGFPSGKFPASVVEISLRSNRLEGEIPGAAVAALPALQVMDLSHNGLSGAVPGAAFEHPSLEQLTLAYNRFESIKRPGDGGLVSRLIALDLGHNRLGGFLPAFLGSMPRLSALSLEDNRFTGMIPAQYAVRVVGAWGAVPFARLILSGNYLSGPVPSPLVGLKEGSAMVNLADNCLFRCPPEFFFCDGGRQKPSTTCREFNPVIP
ncbi:probable LRR receptor-like serine/threonine-protein kinase At4g36180 [Phoenix dactylifera]|uniref:Probable LRR receptor-like serine/threonine-protein kinase At4g36180 n=1 Tax=Phoenix dactylifera TaxID=42345 RepID=A0A8B7CDE3_PHODC|nr:probable LRR receptor-like serine/threonine-protein kinase At4g36180 [Phoenix dactylifera]